jgi:hypothetical protein
MGEIRNAQRSLVGKREMKSPRGTTRLRQEDNIRMDLRKMGWEGVDGMQLAPDRDKWRALVNTIMNLWVT